MNHTSLLNSLIEQHGLLAYLEIGVQNVNNNFNKISTPIKVGVDPEVTAKGVHKKTSDEFFKRNVSNYDLIFIDGDHTAEQVERDFNNSLACLNPEGFIVLHDCLPEKEEHAMVPRVSKVWNGDVYKFILKLNEYDDINFRTLDFDHGCCVVWKEVGATGKPIGTAIDWEFYKHNKDLMRIAPTL